MAYSPALPIAWVTLRVLIVLNWLSGAAILALLIATMVAEQWTFTALGITPSSGIPSMIMGLRAIAVLGLAAIPLNDVVLRRLLAIVETVRRGAPFVGGMPSVCKRSPGRCSRSSSSASSSAASARRFRLPPTRSISMPAFRPAAGWRCSWPSSWRASSPRAR